jgi:hypothetical protein
MSYAALVECGYHRIGRTNTISHSISSRRTLNLLYDAEMLVSIVTDAAAAGFALPSLLAARKALAVVTSYFNSQ